MKKKKDKNRTEQNRTEQNRTEQNRTETRREERIGKEKKRSCKGLSLETWWRRRIEGRVLMGAQ